MKMNGNRNGIETEIEMETETLVCAIDVCSWISHMPTWCLIGFLDWTTGCTTYSLGVGFLHLIPGMEVTMSWICQLSLVIKLSWQIVLI